MHKTQIYICISLLLVLLSCNQQEECENASITSFIPDTNSADQTLNAPESGSTPILVQEMVRVPSDGDKATGYHACEIEAMDTCTPSKVKSVSINAFFIDALPVTNSALQKCIDDGKCTKIESFSLAKQAGAETSKPDAPAVVSYELAKEYCTSVGKSLPTEEQWLAAAMGNQIRKYSWGDENLATATVKIPINQFSSLVNVGSISSDQYNNIYDMSGNGYEWINAPVIKGHYIPNTACDVQNARPCLGAAPLPLYQKIGLTEFSFATFRCANPVE